MENLIHTFYSSFNNLNAEMMNECYHDDVEFWDPPFGTLKGDDAKAMWSLLCTSTTEFRLELSNVVVNKNTGSAHWEAWYLFTPSGRRVHNIIDAKFEFKDGKIIKHTDTFNLHRWLWQAYGIKGLLFGWTRFSQKKIRLFTKKALKWHKNKTRSNSLDKP
jgi:ketosteroid isomerase-like protein